MSNEDIVVPKPEDSLPPFARSRNRQDGLLMQRRVNSPLSDEEKARREIQEKARELYTKNIGKVRSLTELIALLQEVNKLNSNFLDVRDIDLDQYKKFYEASVKGVFSTDLLHFLQPDELRNLVVFLHERDHRFQDLGELKDKLQPEFYFDSDGIPREVVTFTTKNGSPLKTIFYSPEEIPFNSEILEGKSGFVLGEAPKHRKKEDWETFIKNVQLASEGHSYPLNPYTPFRNEAIRAGNAVYFVEASPIALLDFIITLGYGDESLVKMRNQLEKNKFVTKDLAALIDAIIASKMVDRNGDKFHERNYQGEILFLLALQGNTEARQQLIARLSRIQHSDADNQRKFRETGKNENALRTSELIAVHATRYPPLQGSEGQLEMQTTFDATGWTVPRNTIHFALNHQVGGHLMGNWADTPYAILAPLDSLREQNGNPAMLNTVDTFFEVSPGERFTLPSQTTLVQPGEIPEGEVIRKENENYFFRTESFTPEAVQKIHQELNHEGRKHHNDKLRSCFTSDYTDVSGNLLYENAGKDTTDLQLTSEEYELVLDAIGDYSNFIDHSSKVEELGIEAFVDFILQSSSLQPRISPAFRQQLIEKVTGLYVALAKEIAVNAAIVDKGYKVKRGGMWAWNDSWEVTSKTQALGRELGIPVGAHSSHITSKITGDLYGGFGSSGAAIPRIQRAEEPMWKIRMDTQEKIIPQLEKLSPESRRMIYLMGFL